MKRIIATSKAISLERKRISRIAMLLALLLAVLALSLAITSCGDKKGEAVSINEEKMVATEAQSQIENLKENEKSLNSIVATEPISLYSEKSVSSEFEEIDAGEEIYIGEQDDIFWLKVSVGDKDGYVYSGDVLAEEGKSKLSVEVENKLSELKASHPDGKYWNHMGQETYEDSNYDIVTDIPCDNFSNGEEFCNIHNGKFLENYPEYEYLCQCLGYASLISDEVFGYDAPITVFYDPHMLRIGDHLRFTEWEYEHSMIVTSVSDEHITVTEVNRDYETCMINWGRILTFEEIYSHEGEMECFTRYLQNE